MDLLDKQEMAKHQLDQFDLDWETPPKLADLKHDFTNAKPYADEHRTDIQNWLDARNIEGKHKRKSPPGRSSIVPKMIRKQNEWRYSSLTEPFNSTADLIAARPVTASDVMAARQAQLLLNNQWTTKINRVKFFDDYIRTAVDEGTVLLQVGWEYQSKMVMEQVEEMDPYTGMPVVMEVEREVTVKNNPTVKVIPFSNFVVDPTCQGEIENARFVVTSFDTSLSELKNSGIDYKNLDLIGKGVSEGYDGEHNQNVDDGSFQFNDRARKRLVAYEYWGFWDIDDSGIVKPIVATWVDDVLIRLEENPFPDGELPFVLVQYMPVRNNVYGEADAALIEDNQTINGAIMRGAIDIMARSSNGQTASRKGALDPLNKRRKEKGLDFEFNSDTGPQDVFYMQKFQEIPNSVFNMLNLQNNEAESLSGIKAFSSGITGSALGEQGVGIRSALDATSKRELAIQRRLADGITKVSRKFLSMSAEWLSPEEVIRISEEEFVQVDRANLNGDIDIRLSISTPESDNEKAQELAFMLQTIGPNGDPGEVRMIQAEIARLRKMPDLAKKIESYQPPPPTPEQQQMAQLELRKMEAEIMKLEAEAMEAQAKAQELAAKVGTEQAKARHYASDADLKDLNFLEQESGVQHLRKLDEQENKQGLQKKV